MASTQKYITQNHIKTPLHLLHTVPFHTPLSPFENTASPSLHSAPAWQLTSAVPISHPVSALETRLDEVGRLIHPVFSQQVSAWKTELAAKPTVRRAALLHIWLGEWQMAASEAPSTARLHFRQAQACVPKSDPLHGLAAYDSALSLVSSGAFEAASEQFRVLIDPKTAQHGYDRERAALWQRHAFACAGYHAQRAAAGIPEPTRLDPLCGAAGLAASLRSLALPFDKKTVLTACRVTERGSRLQDLLEAAPKLHVHATVVTADDQGLKLLPKPLVAYVEHDHYISVIRADNKGVSYLCSDCGMWPGGRVNLTWKQWHLLEATLYVAVTKPSSPADRNLIAALSPNLENSPLRVSFNGTLADLHAPFLFHLPALSLMRGHVFRKVGGQVGLCGLTVSSLHCDPHCKQPCPKDFPGKKPGGVRGPGGKYGGHAGDPVNLATGEEEYTPPTDLDVYNPHGPSVDWSRIYNSLRSYDSTAQPDDFGSGWSQPYNIQVYDPNVPVAASNPQVLPAVSTSLSSTGNDAPQTGVTWDIIQGTTTLAKSTAPAGWVVSSSSGTLTVTAPAGTSPTVGCEVRYYLGSPGYNASAPFDIVSVVSIPQSTSLTFAAPGTDAPTGSLSWDILENGVFVASSSQPNGWQGSLASYGSNAAISVQTALNAAIGTGYEVRVNSGNYGVHSAFFGVGASRFTPTIGTTNLKYVLEPNGARIQFTASAVPTASQPKVQCVGQAGDADLIEWDYDASSPAGHYTITLADRTRWVMTAPSRDVISGSSHSLFYSLSQIIDRNGSTLNFAYSYTQPTDKWPLLTAITDGSTGVALLSLSRNTNGAITSVSDAYGRSVVYTMDTTYNRLGQVSQTIPTTALGQSGVPLRYIYGYYTIYSHDGYSDSRLHTITVPSPAGGGVNSMVTINYGSDGFVSSLVDANGNTRTYTGDTTQGYNQNPYITTVTVSNAAGTAYTYSVTYDSNMSQNGEVDGAGRTTYKADFADPNDPYRPSATYDGNAAAGFTSGSGPQMIQGGSATFTTSSSGSVADPTWQIFLNSASIATGEAPNGWTVSYNSVAGTFTVHAPSAATVGTGYQLQYRTGGGYGYGPYGSFSVVTSNGKVPTTYTWDSFGNLLTQTSPRLTTTTNTYSYTNFALGELIQEQEGNKSPTTYAYLEPSGLLDVVSGPLPGSVGGATYILSFYQYDALGNPTTIFTLGPNSTATNSVQNIPRTYTSTHFNYLSGYGSYTVPSESIGQPLTITQTGKASAGGTTSTSAYFKYDAQGNATANIDALGNETDSTYTISNAGLQTILAATGQTGSGHAGSQAAYLYAEPTSLATAQWPAVTLQYGPAATTTSYDESGNAIRQVVSAYGPEGELLGTHGSTEPVTYTYDALYRLKTLTDGGSHTTSYFYNQAGYLYQTVYPGAQATPPTAPLTAGTKDTTTYINYDADGNLLSRTDGNNVITGYAYNDPESALTDITYPTGTLGAVHLTYDAYSRRSAMTDSTGGQTYAYDDDNSLTSKTVTWTGLSAKTISYGIYPNGSRQSMNADGHTSTYSYDGVGRMSSQTSEGVLQASYAYLDNGWLQTKTLGNTDIVSYTRDPQGRLLDLANKTSSGTNLSDFLVPSVGGYDGVGNKLAETATIPNCGAGYSGTTHWQYDYGQSVNPQLNRSQVTQENTTRATGNKVYNYDQTSFSGPGNSIGPGNATHFDPYDIGYNADNQIGPSAYYIYDGNGNPTTYKTNALTYDPENRLTSYGTLQTDGWGGDGLRVWKQTGAASTRTYFLYDGLEPIGEYTSTGTWRAANVFGTDGLISRLDPSSPVNTGWTYYSFDTRGAVTERLYANGNSYQVDTYDAPGNRSERLLDYSDPWGFGAQAGYVTDLETGLMLCTHRFYDSVVGRFLTRDPSGSTSGINLYGYCKNDPVNSYDSDGYKPYHTGGNNGGNGVPTIVNYGGTVNIDPNSGPVKVINHGGTVNFGPTGGNGSNESYNNGVQNNGTINGSVNNHPTVAPIQGPPEGSDKSGEGGAAQKVKDGFWEGVGDKFLDFCIKTVIKTFPRLMPL